MLRHASAAMALDEYSDLFPDDLDAVAERLDDEVREKSVGLSSGSSRGIPISWRVPLTCGNAGQRQSEI